VAHGGGFAMKTRDDILTICKLLVQNFYGDPPVDRRLQGLVHRTHAATANFSDDVKLPIEKGTTDERVRRTHVEAIAYHDDSIGAIADCR
jgi:hypothetical protein